MWTKKSPLRTARSHGAAAIYNENIYIFGGGGPDFKSLNSVERYNTQEDKWYEASPMPTVRSGAMAVNVGKKIFVIGGGFKQEDGRFKFLKNVDIFYPEEERWEKGADMLMPHDYPSVALYKNAIYIMGGHHPDATEGGPKTDPGFAFCERMNLDSMVWEEIAALNIPRFALTAIIREEKILTIGGIALTSAGFHNFDIIEEYNFNDNKWSKKEDLTLPWTAAAHNTCLVGDKLFFAGGYSGPKIIDNASVYDFNTKKWNEITPMDKPRAAYSIVQIGNYIYIIGGWEADGMSVMADVISYSIQ